MYSFSCISEASLGLDTEMNDVGSLSYKVLWEHRHGSTVSMGGVACVIIEGSWAQQMDRDRERMGEGGRELAPRIIRRYVGEGTFGWGFKA